MCDPPQAIAIVTGDAVERNECFLELLSLIKLLLLDARQRLGDQARKQIIDATKKVFNVPTSKLIRTEVNSLKPNATIGIYNDEGNIIRLLN